MFDDDLEGFADKRTIKNLYKVTPESFILGKVNKDHSFNSPIGTTDDRGLFVVAGSRSGKGISIIIPNLITWKSGIFVIDPKGENASVTAIGRGTKENALGTGTNVREFLGQNVAILDPFNTVKGAAKAYKVNYNPLSDIDVNQDEATDSIYGICSSIVIQDEGNGNHFTETVETLLAGIIEAVLVLETKPENRTLPYCLTVLQLGFEKLQEYLFKCNTSSGLAREALSILQDVGAEEAGSFRTTFSRQVRFMQDNRMKQHLENSDFSLSHAIQNNWSIYVCIPPSKIKRGKRWLRMITNIALNSKMNAGFDHEGQQVLFCLDEFAALGNMSQIEEASAYMAGYGIKLMPIIQNIGQVKKHYPKNWETFLGNAGTIIAWGLNDLDTEQYFSDRMGKILTDEQSYSESTSQTGKQKNQRQHSISRSTGQKERAVKWANEIHYEGVRETMKAFVISASSAPFMIERVPYFKHFKANQYESLENIKDWEKAHG